jgi:membrane carboxypeptidase/penicillin-binding protein PbpC
VPKLAGEKVDVAWKVAPENSNNQFIVERSYDGRDFEADQSGQIRMEDTVRSRFTACPYALTDLKPLAGANYYRLKQVDFAPVVESSARKGAEWVSRIVSVEFDKTAALSVSPNPSTEYFEIKLNIPAKISKWKLIDINGRLIKDNGTGNRVNITNLSPGEYILEVVTANGDRYSKKVVKL